MNLLFESGSTASWWTGVGPEEEEDDDDDDDSPDADAGYGSSSCLIRTIVSFEKLSPGHP